MNSQPTTTGPLLRAQGIHKHFTSGAVRIDVLRGVDLAVHPGDRISISGESGCGKSTLLNILAGIEFPDTGSLQWGERPVTASGRHSLPALRARWLGFVFQAYYLIPELDLLDNVLLAARIAGLDPLRQARERAIDILRRLGLGERLHSLPGHLSGGERQRTAIARALINQPAIILADEPTGNLDERTSASVIEQLFELVADRRTALVLVTHNPAFARMAEQRLYLRDGRLAAASDPPAAALSASANGG